MELNFKLAMLVLSRKLSTLQMEIRKQRTLRVLCSLSECIGQKQFFKSFSLPLKPELRE